MTITAQEILVDNASYPTPKIEENSHKFRPLGLGYANLGALLMMSAASPTTPDEGRNFAAALTAIMHGEAYRQSAIIARDHGGPFLEYDENREPFLRVIGKHRDAGLRDPAGGRAPTDMLDARRAWSTTRRSSSARSTATATPRSPCSPPPGTIAFMMDCDTTGVEPGHRAHQVQEAGRRGLPQDRQPDGPGRAAQARLRRRAGRGDPRLHRRARDDRGRAAPQAEHLPVFDCAFKPVNGERSIHYMGHVRMMGAIQPFLSGAISKTVNMPEAATAEEIEKVYLEGWKLGLKAIAIYRDDSKRSQPLSTGKKKDERRADAASGDRRARKLRKQLAKARGRGGQAASPAPARPSATAVTHKFDIAGHEGYITVGLYPDGQPGEIFLKMAKEGSTCRA